MNAKLPHVSLFVTIYNIMKLILQYYFNFESFNGFKLSFLTNI